MKKLLKKIAGTILVVVALACGTATLFSCDKGSVNVTLVSESIEKTVFVVKSGDALPVVTAEDRDFEGYWLDSSYTRKYEGVVVPESDVTLYYKQNYQYYTLNLDYGDKGVVSVALRRGVNEVLPDIAPDGTIVAAYSDSSDGEATVLAGGSVKNLAAKGETATLFVKYEIKDVADYVIEDGEVKAYKGKKTQLVLPYGATKIAENAFKDNEKIVSVYVPATYEKIGKGAFSGCKNLETLTVPFIGGSKTSKSFMAYVFVRPDKTAYVRGEKFDATGMVLTLTYSDGSKTEITEGYEIVTKNALTENNRTVRIRYNDLTTTLNVIVVKPDVAGIEINTEPTQKEYETGDEFSTAGLTLKVNYVDGTSEIVYDGYVVKNGAFDKTGKTAVTIEYGGKSLEIEVEVVSGEPTPPAPEPDKPDEEKKGCGASAFDSFSIAFGIGAIAIAAAFVLVKNKKRKD